MCFCWDSIGGLKKIAVILLGLQMTTEKKKLGSKGILEGFQKSTMNFLRDSKIFWLGFYGILWDSVFFLVISAALVRREDLMSFLSFLFDKD